jgi:hypothetical protein
MFFLALGSFLISSWKYALVPSLYSKIKNQICTIDSCFQID